MNKALHGIWNQCPYLSQEEMEKFWRQAKAIASKQGICGSNYWLVVANITKGMAQKLDEKRRKQDEEEWLREKYPPSEFRRG
jgi:hypothetical protein